MAPGHSQPSSAFSQGGRVLLPDASSPASPSDPQHWRWAPGSRRSPPKRGLFPSRAKANIPHGRKLDGRIVLLSCSGRRGAGREDKGDTFSPILTLPAGHSLSPALSLFPLTQGTSASHSFSCSFIHSLACSLRISWGQACRPRVVSDTVLGFKELTERARWGDYREKQCWLMRA